MQAISSSRLESDSYFHQSTEPQLCSLTGHLGCATKITLDGKADRSLMFDGRPRGSNLHNMGKAGVCSGAVEHAIYFCSR